MTPAWKGSGKAASSRRCGSKVRSISDETTFQQARVSSQEHGIPIGAGGVLSGALNICERHPEAWVAMIICDGGEQYFDLLFDAWLALLRRGDRPRPAECAETTGIGDLHGPPIVPPARKPRTALNAK